MYRHSNNEDSTIVKRLFEANPRLTCKEVGRLVGCHPQSVWRYKKEGKIPSYGYIREKILDLAKEHDVPFEEGT